MKNNLILTTLVLGGIAISCLSASFTNTINNGFEDLVYDQFQYGIANIDVRKLTTSDNIEYSKTYTQYAKDDAGAYYLRFATAIKGSDIYSITYKRNEVIGKDETVYPEAQIEVANLYTSLSSNGVNTYYNGTDLVYEESEETKEYYWACYTIRFKNDNCLASNISVTIDINNEQTENIREVTLYSVLENSHTFEEIPSSFDENYHYYECLDAGVDYTKKEAHVSTDLQVVEPTLTETGLTEGVGCEHCDYNTQRELPMLNDVDYDISYKTALVNGSVNDVYTYTLKDTSLGNYSFDVLESVTNYIVAGSTYYSVKKWNETYENQVASYDESTDTLTITLKEGTEITISAPNATKLDGTFNLTTFNHVIIDGNGTINITYSTQHDGIIAYNLTVNDGVTLNLTGYSSAYKCAIKVYQSLNINGVVNAKNFGYGQGFTYDKKLKLTTTIGETGEFNIDTCGYGFYAWDNSWNNTPKIYNYGKLFLTNITNYGMNFNNYDVNIYLRGSSETYISSKLCCIFKFNDLIIGDGDKGEIQNNAKLTCISTSDNVLYTRNTNSNSTSVVFNTLGKVLIESTAGKSKSGIEVRCSNMSKFQVSCADMTVKGCYYAFGTWSNPTTKATYNYDAPNAKLTLEGCGAIVAGSCFSCFTSETVNII